MKGDTPIGIIGEGKCATNMTSMETESSVTMNRQSLLPFNRHVDPSSITNAAIQAWNDLWIEDARVCGGGSGRIQLASPTGHDMNDRASHVL